MAAYMPAELCVVNNGAEYDSCKKSTHLSTCWSEYTESYSNGTAYHIVKFPQIQEYILINLLLHFVLCIVVTGDCTCIG